MGSYRFDEYADCLISGPEANFQVCRFDIHPRSDMLYYPVISQDASRIVWSCFLTCKPHHSRDLIEAVAHQLGLEEGHAFQLYDDTYWSFHHAVSR